MPIFILVLALGTFAIGTEEYLVAGLLPSVAADMHVSEEVAGQLVTVFALTYAIGSPLLVTAMAHIGRKRVLLISLVLFALANLASTLAPSASWLFGTRILAALAAAIYTPTAMAASAQLVEEKLRGRAMSIILAGSTGALVLGLPLGSWVGSLFGWRASFAMVALIGTLSALLLCILLPNIQQHGSVVSWSERLALLTKRHVWLALALTFISLVGANSLLTYIRPVLDRVTTFDAALLSLVLFGIGAASLLGNLLGGYLADRWGIGRTLIRVYALMILITLTISLLTLLHKSFALNIIAVVILVVWSTVAWLGAPALNSYLAMLEPQSAPVVLSLNMTALYLGTAGAGALGGLVLALGGIEYLGATCSLAMLIALLLILSNTRLVNRNKGQAREEVPSPVIQQKSAPAGEQS
ncbi:MFS transporter [Ktedonosporobacter rubrisoli]|nr:MFS transporter [Ktedonosporobacter rubrisoli]